MIDMLLDCSQHYQQQTDKISETIGSDQPLVRSENELVGGQDHIGDHEQEGAKSHHGKSGSRQQQHQCQTGNAVIEDR